MHSPELQLPRYRTDWLRVPLFVAPRATIRGRAASDLESCLGCTGRGQSECSNPRCKRSRLTTTPLVRCARVRLRNQRQTPFPSWRALDLEWEGHRSSAAAELETLLRQVGPFVVSLW